MYVNVIALINSNHLSAVDTSVRQYKSTVQKCFQVRFFLYSLRSLALFRPYRTENNIPLFKRTYIQGVIHQVHKQSISNHYHSPLSIIVIPSDLDWSKF